MALNRTLAVMLLAGAAWACATAALAEDWYAFYMVPSGVAYVDKDSVIHRPGHVSAKVQSSFPEPQRLQKDGRVLTYDKAVDTIDIDCRARVYRFLTRDLYNAAGQKQTSISEADDARLIQARTPEDVLAKAYCPKD